MEITANEYASMWAACILLEALVDGGFIDEYDVNKWRVRPIAKEGLAAATKICEANGLRMERIDERRSEIVKSHYPTISGG